MKIFKNKEDKKNAKEAKQNIKPNFRLTIQVIDFRNKRFDPERKMWILPTKLQEVEEISLGSINKPNNEVLYYRFDPIPEEDEEEEDDDDFADYYLKNNR